MTRLVTLGCLAAGAAFATPLDMSFTEAAPTAGIGDQATGLAWVPDTTGRLFVLRKDGVVRVVQNGALQTAPWVTEPQPVYTNRECGLTGIAFDPGFLSNRFVYLFITKTFNEQRIVRYTDFVHAVS